MSIKGFCVLFLLALVILTSGCIDSEIYNIAKKGDVSLCDDLDTSDNSERIEKCYAAVAKETGNVSICQRMPKESRYIGRCYENVAVKTNNEYLCINIESDVRRENCYTTIAINKNDMSVCTKQVNTWGVDRCILNFAKKAGDVDTCRTMEITDTMYREECILYFAQKNKNELLCEEINDPKYRDDCYLKVAPLISGNLLCRKIDNQAKREQCHMKLAVIMNNEGECSNIEYETYSWYSCIKQVAVAKKDKNICSLMDIKNTEEIKSCKMQVANAIASE